MTTKSQSTTTKLEASEPTLEPSLEDLAIEAAELLDSLPTYVSDQTIRRAQQIAFALRACNENARARVSANGVPTVDHANESKRDQEAGFLRTIAEGLRHAIRDHGPITSEWIGSASKRVYSRLKGTKYVK